MTPETKEIIVRMVKVRKNEGLNQEKFAEVLGMTRGALSMIEAFKANPSVQMVIGVIKNFETTYEWLLEGNNEPSSTGTLSKSVATHEDIDALKKQIAAVFELQQFQGESIDNMQGTIEDLKLGNSKLG